MSDDSKVSGGGRRLPGKGGVPSREANADPSDPSSLHSSSSLLWLNGAITPVAEARVSPASAGVLYGWGVFTTLGLRGGKPRAFERHWERLVAHAGRAAVPVERDATDVEAGLRELAGRLGLSDGRARITLLRGAGGPWREKEAGGDTLVFAAARAPRAARPLALTVSPYRLNTTSPLAGVKSTAFVEHLLALEEARGRGFDEALMLNERGEVAEGTAANVFWVRGGELFTPSLATGCLAGITRRLVLEVASRLRIRATEGGFPLAAVGEADEVFLTNSTWGLSPVGQFDVHRYGQAPLAARLGAEVDKLLG
jgi:branched-chain amino acid aminotransferase